MNQAAENKVKDFFGKYWSHIALILLLLFHFSCDRTKDYQSKIVDLKLKKAASEATVKLYSDQNLVLQDSVKLYKSQLADLEKITKKLKEDKVKVQNKGKAKLAEVKKYKSADYQKYFEKRYGDFGKSILNEQGLILTDSIPKKVIVDLVTGDTAKEELKITEDLLDTETAKSEVKDSIIKNKDGQIGNLNLIVGEKDNINADLEALAKKQEREIQRQNEHNKALKIAAPAAFILGTVTGFLLVR